MLIDPTIEMNDIIDFTNTPTLDIINFTNTIDLTDLTNHTPACGHAFGIFRGCQ